MPQASIPRRPRSHTLALAALWIVFYASFTLFRPALLDDADSVHAEVAREMLLRHDYVTLYANGIRYLEKAPLLYWSMAFWMRISQLLGHGSASCLAVAARIPLALTVLLLAFAVETFARRAFRSARAGLYAALILLSSPGLFLFTRITLPDAMVCLWLTLALLCFWHTEQPQTKLSSSPAEPPSNDASSRPEPKAKWRDPRIFSESPQNLRMLCSAFAACCALGVLTKGLIGAVFPIAIVAVYLLLTRGPRAALTRIRQLHPFTSLAVFLLIAAPWHILIALANPTQGHPGGLAFAGGHWQIPLPTDGNVHGWAWFYFVNEQLLRYLNLRVPRDYDTVPLWLFYGLCFIWMMPWSAFAFKAVANALPLRSSEWRTKFRARALPPQRLALLLVAIWAAIPLLFFSLSTRQEYYVLPALPAIAILIAGWLAGEAGYRDRFGYQPIAYSRFRWMPASAEERAAGEFRNPHRTAANCAAVLLGFGTIFAAASIYFLLRAHTPSPSTDLAALLQQNPSDYAMSMGHFLDLNAQALALFRLPLALAAASLFIGPLVSHLLRRRARPHAANLALAAGAFGFLFAAHLALQTFAPVLSSAQLAQAIAPQLTPDSLIVIHQEYEYGSTLGFYLQRPSYQLGGVIGLTPADLAGVKIVPAPINPIHILTEASYNGTTNYGRSSNLWYGSFFPDAPAIFETPQSLAQKWPGPQRIFLWQDLAGEPSPLPAALTPVYVVAKSGGKEIVSNKQN
ncbi:MAG: phospholipid carrier-dependent glycosyltransferase [Acidobacteriaceae bacterium]|jgi:4-amino-4-deoxy-L-arabinose transferase-like glycosyltransferase